MRSIAKPFFRACGAVTPLRRVIYEPRMEWIAESGSRTAQSTAYRSLFQIQPELSALDNKYQKVRAGFMMYVTTISVRGLTPTEYRAVLDKMGVETHPDAHIYLHLTTPMESGFRVIEIWDDKEAFEEFLKNRLGPANEVLGISHSADITIDPLHNFFAPRLDELPGVISSLPGSPGFKSPE